MAQRSNDREDTRLSDVTAAFAEALTLHQAGRLVDAEKIYNRILAVQPSNAEALTNRGVALHELKRFDEALASYDRALAVQPALAVAHSNRGNTLKELGRLEEAVASYDRALALRPDYAEAYYNRGNALHAMGRFEEALASHDRALALRPDYADALANRGVTLHKLKRFAQALASHDRALAARPGDAEILDNRGVTLHELNRFDEALASHDRALALRPDDADALSNRGHTLRALKRFEEALASYDRTLEIEPDRADVLSNRGDTLRVLNRYEEALASCDRALEIEPDRAETHYNRSATLYALRRFDEALASCERAVAARPDYAEAHFNAACCRLVTGDFARGWEKTEWRWEIAQRKTAKRNFIQPLWTGSDEIAGKTILLHAEQGFGDTIQFARYVPRVAQRGARVILEVQKPLRELIGTLPGAAQIVSRGDALPDFDIHCPLLSLPRAFATRLGSIPGETPYLRASPQAVADWNERLGRKSRPRIGLAWSGNPIHVNDTNRSIAFHVLRPLLNLDATYVSLQRDVRAEDATALQNCGNLFHTGEALKNFADTAALIANLDLTISVDTGVAHLAGALAKPVWVLLPFASDWRWLVDREDSPWYPTARLFRQDNSRTWDSVVARVHAALVAELKVGT